MTFRWHDYRQHYAAKTTTLRATEFLRRFATHIVPPRLVRVRYFGLLSNRDRRANIAHARELIGGTVRLPKPRGPAIIPCPQCGGMMRTVLKIAPYIPRTWFDDS